MSAALLELEALRITHDGAVRATPDGVTFSIDSAVRRSGFEPGSSVK